MSVHDSKKCIECPTKLWCFEMNKMDISFYIRSLWQSFFDFLLLCNLSHKAINIMEIYCFMIYMSWEMCVYNLSVSFVFLDAIASLECGYESEWGSQSVWFRQIMIILQNIACIHIEYRYIECSLNTHWIIAKHGAIHI